MYVTIKLLAEWRLNNMDDKGQMHQDIQVTGTLIWYYYICKREVWLMAHQINPDEDNPNLDIGRFIQEYTYQRDKKEVSVGHIKLDIVKRSKDKIVVAEVKKSSKFENSATMQLAYYLYELEKMGLKAEGELRFPKERRVEKIELTDNLRRMLDEAVSDILKIVYLDKPLKPVKIGYCKNCAYAEFCWA